MRNCIHTYTHLDSAYELWTHANFINFDKWNTSCHNARLFTDTDKQYDEMFHVHSFSTNKTLQATVEFCQNSYIAQINCRHKSSSYLNIVENTHRNTHDFNMCHT